MSGNKSGNDVGLVNVQQGIENSGKVLGIGQDGLVIPVENAGASDNIIYKDVAKQLNPNITDSFQRAMWNLKLYGQSIQGADPSPTNPQPITAISEFDGNIRNSFQLFDASKIVNQEISGVTISSENGKINLSGTATKSFGFQYSLSNQEFKELFKLGNVYIKNNTNLNLIFTLYIKNDSGAIDYAQQNKSLEITDDLLNNQQNYAQFYFFITQGTSLNGYVRPMIYQDGDGTWEPFDSNPQEVLYTPTNPMYSTQDGSIADYVDVEKGVEVYNMSGAVVIDGTKYTISWDATDKRILILIGNALNVGAKRFYVWCDKGEYSSTLNEVGTIFLFNDVIYYYPDDDSIQNDNGAKEWLSQNPITVVYPLATPTETPIDPEQLQMLRALYTYNGVTNFLCNAPVSFTYERSLQIVINNLENAIGQTNANILLGGNQ